MWRELSDLSPELIATLISSEDQRFLEHGGVDVWSLPRALHFGGGGAGVSTITLQVARLLRPPSTRTPGEKLTEIALALSLERRLSKREILTEYVNRLPLGRRTLGVEAAAWAYFGHSARSTTSAEAIFLASLAPAPSRRGSSRQEACAAFAQLAVRRQVATKCPETVDFTFPGRARHANELGLTTIESRAQDVAELALARARQRILLDGVHDGSIVVVDVGDDSVSALVGSVSGSGAPFVNAAVAWRQAGSVLKPFLYAMYLGDGNTLDAFLPDVPRCFRERSGRIFCPQNNSGVFHGRVTARVALASSLNVASTVVLERVGVERYLIRLQELGLAAASARPSHVGLGLALGDSETNLLALTRGFASLVRGGDGVFSKRAALDVIAALSDADARRLGFQDRAMTVDTGIAYKTGTSSFGRDLWAVGSDGKRAVGVWLGNVDGAPTSAMAIDTAAVVMNEVFRGLSSRGEE
jgi:penicillin-binding protein 1C